MHTTTSENIANPEVITALLGEHRPRPLQEDVLKRIREGYNTMAVFGTSQGKSILFQIPAAERALSHGKKTMICYPLRSLTNDQYTSIHARLGPLGLRILRANGSISVEEREQLDMALSDGSWDIMLATPEFAMYHAERLALPFNRPDFVVLDEAHHLFESRHRSGYRQFAKTLAQMGNPQTAAFTATAKKETFEHIVATLGIQSWVINPAERNNLHIVDQRNNSKKNEYILKLALEGNDKTIVYCNSKKITKQLSDILEVAGIEGAACYHADMSTKDRRQVENDFRLGTVRFIIATSAFGEGIDLPDVRNVVMYHLNFNMVAFNQMAGRAGRDGQPSRIHLLYGNEDRRLNDFIIAKQAPTRAVIREIYTSLRKMNNGDIIHYGTYVDFALTFGSQEIGGAVLSSAIKILEEVGLAETGKDEDGKYFRALPTRVPVEIEKSQRYLDSLAERESFNIFCAFAMGEGANGLQDVISRPIYPNDIALHDDQFQITDEMIEAAF